MLSFTNNVINDSFDKRIDKGLKKFSNMRYRDIGCNINRVTRLENRGNRVRFEGMLKKEIERMN